MTEIPAPPPPRQVERNCLPESNQARHDLAVYCCGDCSPGLIVFGIILLAAALATTTARAGYFHHFMALESLILGVGLIILIVQLATLINLLQNEIKPIL